MKVKELITQLQKLPQNADIKFQYGYDGMGNICRDVNIIATDLTGRPPEVILLADIDRDSIETWQMLFFSEK